MIVAPATGSPPFPPVTHTLLDGFSRNNASDLGVCMLKSAGWAKIETTQAKKKAEWLIEIDN